MSREKKKRRQTPAAILPETEQRQYSNEELANMIQDGEDKHGEMMLQLLTQNKGFIYKVSKPFLIAKTVEPEELQSIAFIALCAAVDYFRSDAGASFLYCLKPFLLRELILASNCSAPVGLPVNLRTMLNKYRRFCSQYQTAHGSTPPDYIVTAELHITTRELENLKAAELSQQAPVSLNAYITNNTADSEDGETCLLDAIPDDTADTADAALQSDLCAAIRDAVAGLPDQEREEVLNRYFYSLPVADIKALQSGMKRLRTPAAANRLYPYLYAESIRGTGFTRFIQTGFSATERTALERCEGAKRGK